jgi:hypothetical protein
MYHIAANKKKFSVNDDKNAGCHIENDLVLHYEEVVSPHNTKAVCKIRGLTSLLRVGTLWRYGDGLFFEVPPLASEAILTTLYPLLEYGIMDVLK